MKFLELYQDKIVGAISGLDRIRFRGALRWLASQRGLASFMGHSHMLLKDFAGWVNGLTARIRDSCQSRVRELGIEIRYLARSGINKEKARQIAMEKGITAGSICMFSVVEPCRAPMVKGNKASKKLEVTLGRLCAELEQCEVEAVILPLALPWALKNHDRSGRTWPTGMMVERFIEILKTTAAKTPTRDKVHV